jgi:hypothetical protein
MSLLGADEIAARVVTTELGLAAVGEEDGDAVASVAARVATVREVEVDARDGRAHGRRLEARSFAWSIHAWTPSTNMANAPSA